MLLPFDPPADRHDPLGLRQIDRLLRLLERRFGLLADLRGVHGGIDAANGGVRAAAFHRIGAIRADLDGDEMRRRPLGRDLRGQLALKHGTDVRRAASLRFHGGHVGDQRASEPRGERRREVARLVGVREEDAFRRFLPDQRLERHDVAVRGVLRERGRIDDDDLGRFGGRQLGGERVDRGSRERDLHRAAGRLRGGDRLPRRAIQLAFALFCHHQDHEITLASSRSFCTSALAASAGEPCSICVCLPFSGKDTLTTFCAAVAAAANGALRISFFFAAMIPFRVA